MTVAVRKVLDVGNCGPDHTAISRMLTDNFEVEVVQSHGLQDTFAQLESEHFDLVLINRKLDQDYSDGINILVQLKADSRTSSVPVMLVTNLQEHQDQAVAQGALPGFGKLALNAPETLSRLSAVLN